MERERADWLPATQIIFMAENVLLIYINRDRTFPVLRHVVSPFLSLKDLAHRITEIQKPRSSPLK